ncbi:CD59 glycoprotein [Microcaecilia unicolor]|uniref:MAC-inhibitory protein n=1 Tax=Microcaecilia unicolor TaxID=1415580 RepID=A0A6P7XUF0_9AMPH|nr:CD59 glycoprotein-like [Microcaecilia unicolor]
MSGNKWNCVLLSLFFLFLVFCSSGYALKCLVCTSTTQVCTTNHTCPKGDYSCLRITVGTSKTYRCEQHNNCKVEILQKEFGNSFSFYCCQGNDLCNTAIAIPAHKTLLGLLTLIAVVWLVCF